MSSFDELWRYIVKRSADVAIPVVQEYHEMEHVFNLLKDCTSYLEVGSAEGNSLFVYTNAMKKGSDVAYVDLGEKHTKPHRDALLIKLASDYKVLESLGDSNDFETFYKVANRKYDAVLIDAGHDDFNVAIDALFYGPLATKYIIFHDVQLPDVQRVFAWYCKQFTQYKNYRIANSETYGYGIICLQ